MKWQPIESAPRDEAILVYSRCSGICVSWWWIGVSPISDYRKQGWATLERDNRDESMILEGPVTHWMPLPEPPNEQA